MPAFGSPTQEQHALTPVGFDDPRKMNEYGRTVRNSQRMNVPDEPEPITQLSEEQRVYIYNAGCLRFEQSMGSYGSYTVQALPEAEVFDGIKVAGPLAIEGLPKEYYPGEGVAKTLYHQPRKNMGRESRRPGYDFAMEVIGVGMMVNQSNDLRAKGVFISDQREQKEPAKDAPKPMHEAYARWVKDVKSAQASFRRYCAKVCQNANVEHARGKFADIRNDELYIFARLIKGTALEYKWLGDTEDAAKNQNCPGCGQVVKLDIIKCRCGYRVCSDEVWNKVKERYT